MSDEITFSFINNNIKYLNPEQYEKDFTFVVNGKEYNVSKCISDILSPKISKIHQIDPSYEFHEINTQNYGDFGYFMHRMLQNDINNITKKERKFILEVLFELGNENYLNLSLANDEISEDNVFDRIERKKRFSPDDDSIIGEELEFIAIHFYNMSYLSDMTSKLSIANIYSILSNPKLCIESEDSLFDFLNDLLTENTILNDCGEEKKIEIYELFEFIHFNLLSDDNMTKFIDSFEIKYINTAIWRAICKRLEMKIDDDSRKTELKVGKNRYSNLKVFYNGNNKLNGIISYYQNVKFDNGKNVVENGVMKVAASSVYDQRYDPINAVKINEESLFWTLNQPNQYIMYEFVNNTNVVLSHYTIRSAYDWDEGFSHPRNWVVEASLDGQEWVELDRREDDDSLNGRNHIVVFDVYKQVSAKYIRLKQTGPNWCNSDYFAFTAFEIFGEIIDFN